MRQPFAAVLSAPALVPMRWIGSRGRSPDLRVIENRRPSHPVTDSGITERFLGAYSGGAVPDFHQLPKLRLRAAEAISE